MLSLINCLKQTKYRIMMELSLIIEAVVLWQTGFEYRWLIIFILWLGIGIVFSWWAPELSSDLSLFNFVLSEIFFLGLIVYIVQPSDSVRSLLQLGLLGWFWVGYTKKLRIW